MELHYSHPMWRRISVRGRLCTEEEIAAEERAEEERARQAGPVPDTVAAMPPTPVLRTVRPATTTTITPPPTALGAAGPSRAYHRCNDKQAGGEEELEEGEIVEEVEREEEGKEAEEEKEAKEHEGKQEDRKVEEGETED